MINVDHNPIETEEGVWAPPYKGVEFLLAHVSCMAFQKKLARLQQPYAKKIEKGTLSPEIQKEVLCRAMAGTIVRNWRGPGMVNNNKESVAYSDDMAYRVLMQHIDVREYVTEFSQNLDNYREEEAEELGNT